jgi:hypothetical protein
MRSIHRLAVTSAVIGGLLGIGLTTASSASAGVIPMPSDCHTLQVAGSLTTTLTCTDRPANQTWEYGASCYIKPGQLRGAYGNEVTGDGTSTITDCPGATNATFVVIS